MFPAAGDVPRVEGFAALSEVESDGCVVAGGQKFLAVPPRCVVVGGSVYLKEPVVVC